MVLTKCEVVDCTLVGQMPILPEVDGSRRTGGQIAVEDLHDSLVQLTQPMTNPVVCSKHATKLARGDDCQWAFSRFGRSHLRASVSKGVIVPPKPFTYRQFHDRLGWCEE